MPASQSLPLCETGSQVPITSAPPRPINAAYLAVTLKQPRYAAQARGQRVLSRGCPRLSALGATRDLPCPPGHRASRAETRGGQPDLSCRRHRPYPATSALSPLALLAPLR